jgi:hypothetical protein
VCFPQRIDVEDLVAWLDATNAARPASERVTLFHVLVTAVARTVRLRPEVNRFVAGRRTYQHRDISVSFVVKSELSDAGTESEARLVVDGWETVLPGPLMDAIPLYTSVYLVNAGSLGIDAPFHHLHETGTAGVVVSIGRVAPEPVVDEAGHVVVQALTRDDTGEALAHAQDVRGLEAALGVDVELDVQQWALTTVPWLVTLATWFYVWGYVRSSSPARRGCARADPRPSGGCAPRCSPGWDARSTPHSWRSPSSSRATTGSSTSPPGWR